MATRLFMGQGKMYIAEREAGGTPKGFSFLGNCPEVIISAGRAAARFATGGTETDSALVPRGDLPIIQVTLDEFFLEHLARILYGQSTSISPASVVNEPIIASTGKTVALKNMNLSASPTVKDSTETITYTKDVDYTENLKAGSLEFSVAGSTIPDQAALKVSYSYGAYQKVSAFTIAPAFHWLRMEGWNTAVSPITPIVLDVYKVKFRPATSFPMIGDDLALVQLEAVVHRDVLQPDNTEDGRFFRLRRAT